MDGQSSEISPLPTCRNGDCVVNCDNTNNTNTTDGYRSTAKLPSTNHKLLKIMVVFFAISTIGLASFVIYKETNGSEKLTEVSNIEPNSQAMKGTVDPPTQSAHEESGAGSHIETYRLDREGKGWVAAEPRNTMTFSEPVQNKLCIRIKIAALYEVRNKIALQYEKSKSVYHALRHIRVDGSKVARGLKDYLVEKNNFQWDPPQTGRTPSTLMTAGSIAADVGDLLCVQTGQTTDIYVSWTDNHFLLKKVG